MFLGNKGLAQSARDQWVSGFATRREIGPISITENFATVGVPSAAVDEVIDAMKRTTIKGKKAKVRRDRDE